MRHLIALLLFSCAVPVLGGGIVNNGDGTSTLTSTAKNKFPMGICGLIEGWAPPTTLTCDGTWRGKTWVELEVCDEATADLLPTQECTQVLVTVGACLDGWQNAPKVTIPQANKCGPVAFWYIVDTNKTHGINGLKKLAAQRKLALGDTSGEWN